MKRYTKIFALAVAGLLTVATYASAERIIGITGTIAQIEATGTETLKDSANVTTHEEEANAIIPSLFLELATDGGFGLGVDMITGTADLSAGDRTTTKNGGACAASSPDCDTGINTADAEIDGVTTIYLIKSFSNGLLVKVGQSSADVNTKETLASGTKYGNTSVDGMQYGIGWGHTNDSGLFFRTTVEITDYDELSLTGDSAGADAASFNVVKANIDTTVAKISIGKAF